MAVTVRGLAPVARAGALALGGLGVLALYALAIWHAPEFLINQDLLVKAVPEQRLSAEHNARLIVISVGGALVVGTGLLYTARNYRLAHRGQVTERFTKALERLGSDELYIRIGGVHALEHVMRDSPDHRDDVVEVLVAFIRDRAPRRSFSPEDETQWMHPPIGTDGTALPDEPDPDVQAALVALGKRPHRINPEQEWVHLSGLHLKGASLSGARLNFAGLERAQLQRANMIRTQLRHAQLEGVQLRGAIMINAELRYARLWNAQLQHANLRGAQLQHADLRNAQFQHANLRGAQLQGADLTGAQFQDADLTGAAVTAAQLRTATLSAETILPEGAM